MRNVLHMKILDTVELAGEGGGSKGLSSLRHNVIHLI